MVEEKKLPFGLTLKYWDTLDVGLFKLAIFTFTLFLVSVWPAFANWAINTFWVWFLVAAIIFAIRPAMKVWKK